MGMAIEARRLLEKLPAGVRERVGRLAAWAPRPLLYGTAFRRARDRIAATERLPAADLEAWQGARLQALVRYAYDRVPYYRRVMDERGVRPEHVRGPADLRLLPLLTRDDIRERTSELLARGLPASRRERVSTGGTSGVPLEMWIDRDRSSSEWAFMTWQWGSAGYRLGDRRLVLRGHVVRGTDGGRLHEWHPLLDELVLSTFHLSSQTLPHYLERIEHYRPVFLHAYPSSAESLARLLEDTPREKRPVFRAVLLGSENLYPTQREYLERQFGCRVYAWYGHTEKCLLGGGCEVSNDYHLFPQYGVLEVVDERGEPVPPGGRGRIVGTGFLNRVLPCLRYATDDLGTLVEGSCACGRAYPRLADIEGRWEGERLYGTEGREFSVTALNTHRDILRSVRRFQIRQDKPGEAIILVVPGTGYGEEDARRIAQEYTGRTGRSIVFQVQAVEEIPLTGRGKFKFVDQRLSNGATAKE